MHQVKLGRMTDWKNLSDDLQAGQGLRSFLVDGEEEIGGPNLDAFEKAGRPGAKDHVATPK